MNIEQRVDSLVGFNRQVYGQRSLSWAVVWLGVLSQSSTKVGVGVRKEAEEVAAWVQRLEDKLARLEASEFKRRARHRYRYEDYNDYADPLEKRQLSVELREKAGRKFGVFDNGHEWVIRHGHYWVMEHLRDRVQLPGDNR